MLKKMNGNNADTTAKRIQVRGESSSVGVKKVKPAIAKSTTPAASPSSPSIILIALVNAITEIIVIGIDNIPNSKGYETPKRLPKLSSLTSAK